MVLFTLILPIIIGLAILIGILCSYVIRTWTYFIQRNIKFVRGIPLFGSCYRALFGLESPAISYQRCYEQYPAERFIGIYDIGGRPLYLLRDRELIAQLQTTHADYFTKHNDQFDCDHQQKATEADVKRLHGIIDKCSERFVEAIKATDRNAQLVDTRNLFTRYANDVIAASAFGIEINSMNEANGDSLLIDNLVGQSCFNRLISQSVKVLLKLINVPIVTDRKASLLKNYGGNGKHFAESLIKKRSGDKRTNGSDFNKLSNVNEDWSNEKAMADCMIFFIDSFHAIASSACFLLHELAINPDIQSKLYNEIESIQKHSSNESLSYEALAAMKYLDMVVSEAFRRWCPIPQLQLTCAKPLCWAQSDGSSVQLTTGDNVLIPTYAIHMDADNFAKPEKFDPERFNETTKNSSKPNTFLPFGVSDTNNHIGVQFAIMQIKTLTFYLLSEFYIDKCTRTQDPVVLKPSTPNQTLDAEKGFHVELRPRNPDRSPYKSRIFI